MALYYELPIYKACYQLLLDLFRMTRNFNREYKYTIGQDIKTNAMNMVMFIFKANSSVDKTSDLLALNDSFELLKLELRLCVDMKLISPSQQAGVWEQMDVIGRQLTGWRKSSAANVVNNQGKSLRN
ncbi:four helix bundle protein [Dysgonomonas sp. 521]|uniref:four helix bundle protein n=1 Tax=Dysgonomonas sp. 521 TaxID=2302932 RepID=UPI0013D64920|nr:four helix bundle protein [Dysgonomonas sp. 521]NDV97479.1 four helix bundle protein [Dysgonomonas sp. 521]